MEGREGGGKGRKDAVGAADFEGLADVSLRRPKLVTLIGESTARLARLGAFTAALEMAREGELRGKEPAALRSYIDFEARRRRREVGGMTLTGVSSRDMREEVEERRGKGIEVPPLLRNERRQSWKRSESWKQERTFHDAPPTAFLGPSLDAEPPSQERPRRSKVLVAHSRDPPPLLARSPPVRTPCAQPQPLCAPPSAPRCSSGCRSRDGGRSSRAG